MALEDYKDLVATCAMVSTMGHMLSGTFICKDIYRKGTTKGFDPMPFVGGIGMCLLMFRYAWILQDPTMINVNIFGLLTNAVYLAVFYYYTPQTKELHALMGKALALLIVLFTYAHLESSEKIEFRFGMIITILQMMLIASPLVHIGEIIRTKNTDILPFPLILMGTVVFSQWFLYGIIINNGFVIFQNAMGFTLCATQLSLFAIFPSKPSASLVEQKKD